MLFFLPSVEELVAEDRIGVVHAVAVVVRQRRAAGEAAAAPAATLLRWQAAERHALRERLAVNMP